MAQRVFQIPKERFNALKEGLTDQGFLFSQAPHALFSAKKPGVTCILYPSGKLLVQGKEGASFIEFYLEPEILQSVLPSWFSFCPPGPLIGSDEAGKGDFFGPLCVAGFAANSEQVAQLQALGVQDSKTLSDQKVHQLADKLKKFPHTCLVLFPERYNALYQRFKNLNTLLSWAHAAVIDRLAKQTGYQLALVDQFAKGDLIHQLVAKEHPMIGVTTRCGAEEHPVVAAASILAREAFLNGLKRLSEEVEMSLPKGGGEQTVLAGKRLLEKNPQFLKRVCKEHFKNLQQILAAKSDLP